MTKLVALNTSSNALAECAAAEIISTAHVPDTIIKAVIDIRYAFQAGPTLDDVARARTQQLIVEAVAGVPECVGKGVLKSFVWKNPRNPFAPTPQDIRERCEETQRLVRRRVVDFYLSDRGWHQPYKFGADIGPAPGAECLFPESLLVEVLREEIERMGDERFDDVPEYQFASIPGTALPDERRKRLIVSREAYLAELSREQEWRDRRAATRSGAS